MKSRVAFAAACLLAALHTPCAPGAETNTFESAAGSIERQLQASIEELAALRKQIAAEKIPLSRKLNDLETDLVQVRQEHQEAIRLLDSSKLNKANLKTEIQKRQDEITYLSNLLGEYVRNLESRLHIAETQRYEDQLEAAKLAAENTALPVQEVFEAQSALLSVSLDRLGEALGGARFDGTAVDPAGAVRHGTFVLMGPAALFRSDDGQVVGTAEPRLGSLEPAVIPFSNPLDAEAAAKLIAGTASQFPLDPTLGNAHKIEETQETFLEHIKKGGVVMYPIIALASVALLVAILKWLSMAFIPVPSQKKIRALLHAVARRDKGEATQITAKMGGPVGNMLRAGVEHLKEPRDLIEEIMYETIMATRLKLNRFLPFIALTASSAPLLGLLGTVTGIMNTFTLMTVFGSGDIKTLSGGISEALITTESGLYVAIPSLLIFAFLSRRARRFIDEMEKAAVAFSNEVGKSREPDKNDEPRSSSADREDLEDDRQRAIA